MKELAQTFDVGRSEDAYLASIAGKTASLMASACRIGALTAGLDRSDVEAVTAYGQRFGMVFQIVDDVLDVVAAADELGKPAGNDLVEGVYTLPVIRALASTEADDLRKLLAGPLGPDEVEQARAIIRSNGAVPAAITVARRYADEAAESLSALSMDGPVVDALRELGHHLLESVPA